MTTPQQSLVSSPASAMSRRNWRLIIFGMIGLCLLFVAGYVQRAGEQAQVAADIVAVKADIALARQRQLLLADELAQIDAPARIAALARDDFGYVQPDDKPIVVVAPPVMVAPTAVLPTPTPVTKAGAAPNWQQWLQVLGFGVNWNSR